MKVEVSNGPATTAGDGSLPVVVVAQDAIETIQVLEQGPPGPQGPAGPPSAVPGPEGPPGNTILYGTTPPNSATGTDGDFYINKTNNFIYGPKAGNSWPAGTSLVGPQGPQGPQGVQGVKGDAGAQGAPGTQGPAGPQGPQGLPGGQGAQGVPGNTVLYGAGDPAAGTGVDGNFYINTTSNFIFGPKAAGAWPAGASLIGPAGPAGPQGAEGAASTVPGPAGPAGPQGDPGPAGAASTVPGPAGADGAQGPQGIQGPIGPQGPQGATGAAGSAAGSIIPQGRLTLNTGTPIMLAQYANVGAVIYTPHNGLYVPVFDGSDLVASKMGGELGQLHNDATKSPAAAAANKNHDVFYWLDAGVAPIISRGFAWASDISRGANGLIRKGGILVNAVAVTNGPAAERGTYLGTIRTNANGLTDWIANTTGTPVAANQLGLWNKYNRERFRATLRDTGASYQSWGQWNAHCLHAGTRWNFLRGLDEDPMRFFMSILGNPPSAVWQQVGFCFDSAPTSGPADTDPGFTSSLGMIFSNGTVIHQQITAEAHLSAALGWHYVQAMDYGSSTSSWHRGMSHLLACEGRY